MTDCSVESGLHIGVAIIIISIALLYIRRFSNKVERSSFALTTEEVTSFQTGLTANELDALKQFKEQLRHLQEVAGKISEEAASLTGPPSDEAESPTSVQPEVRLKEKQADIQERLGLLLQGQADVTAGQFDESEKALDALRSELTAFKKEVEEDWRGKEESGIFNTESGTQTEEKRAKSSNKENPLSMELFDNQDLKAILLAIKDVIEGILKEKRWNWKKTVMEVSSFLEEGHSDLKAHLRHLVEENSDSRQEQAKEVDTLTTRTQEIEKLMLDVFIYLDRQMVDVQAVSETLRFFDRKFSHFADKCMKRWKDSSKEYDSTSTLLQEAEQNLNFSSGKISRIICCMTVHSEDVEELLKLLQSSRDSARASRQTAVERQVEEITIVADDMCSKVTEIEKKYRHSLSNISTVLDLPGRKLKSLLQYVEDLEVLNDLVKNIATTYQNMITSAFSMRSLPSEGYDFSRLRSVQDLRDFMSATTMSRADVQTTKGVDEGAGTTEFSLAGTESMDKASRRTISPQKIMTMFDKAIKNTVSRAEKSKMSPRNHREQQGSEKVESEVTNKDCWGFGATDIPLSDLDSDYLLPLSSDDEL